jgi:hypothetical protein
LANVPGEPSPKPGIGRLLSGADDKVSDPVFSTKTAYDSICKTSATIIEVARICVCKRIRQKCALSDRQKLAGSLPFQQLVVSIIGTNAAPPNVG